MTFASGRAGRVLGMAAAIGAGYLVGTTPSADVAAKVASAGTIDLRREGSGNPGGLNAARLLGKRVGAVVMGVDIAKGALAAGLGGLLAGGAGAHVGATSAVVGHCYPVWSGFKGGKGVGTSFGQCLATFPAYAPVDLAIAGITTKLGKPGSQARLGTTIASSCWVAAAAVAWRRGWRNLWGPAPSALSPLAAAVTSGLVLYRFAAAERAKAAAASGATATVASEPEFR